MPVFESLEDLRSSTRYGEVLRRIRIIQALIVRFTIICREQGIELPNRNFTIGMNRPFRCGSAWAGRARLLSALRGLCQYYSGGDSSSVQAKLALERRRRNWAFRWTARSSDPGLRGLVYHGFRQEPDGLAGYGEYERLDPCCCRTFIWRIDKFERGHRGVSHPNVRRAMECGRFRASAGDGGMANLCGARREALLAGDVRRWEN